MLRRWLFVIVIILFLGSIVSGYFYLRYIKREIISPINAIPKSAVLVFESTNFIQNWNKQSATSLLFKEFKTFEGFANYDSLLSGLDTALVKSTYTSFLFKDHPVLISLVRSGAKSFNILYTFNLPPEVNTEGFLKFIEDEVFEGAVITSKQFDQANIFTAEFNGASIAYCMYKDVFSFSTNSILVEDAVKQLNSDQNILNQPEFKNAYDTKGNGNDGNLYVNTPEFLGLISGLSSSNNSLFKPVRDFGNWAALDLFLKPNNLMLNGFFHTNDSLELFLNRFKSQNPQNQDILEFLPKSTALILGFGVSSFKAYYKQYLQELEFGNNKFDYDKNLKTLQDSLGILPIETFQDLTENEFGLAILEPVLSSPEANAIAYFKTTNAEAFNEQMQQFSTNVDSFKVDDDLIKVSKIHHSNLLKSIYGEAFAVIKENYFITLEGYLFFSNNISTLKDLAIKSNQGNTLSKDINFNAFQENLGSESNFMLYLNIGRSTKIIGEIFNENGGAFFTENKAFFNQFEALSFQVSKAKNQLSYANVFLNHNPGYKQESGSLWEMKLKAPVISKPFAFTNHYTKAKEIFIQDSTNGCYLISNTGKVLWEKALEGPIKSRIYQVDAYKNNKYQLLFATKNEVHLFDRKGRYVDGYPIKIKNITSGFACLDYDNNREYRILIPTDEGALLNFNIKGEKVRGWKYKNQKQSISKMLFFQKSRKDYIVCLYKNGAVKALNRKGEVRLTLKQKLPFDTNLEVFIQPGEKLSGTSIVAFDSLRNINKLFFNDKLEAFTQAQVQTREKSSAGFGFVGEDLKPFYITTENGNVNIFNEKVELINLLETESSYFISPQTFADSQGKVKIALIAKKEKRVFLVNQFGRLIENYPFAGSTAVCIDDFNLDGNLNLVTATASGKLFMYSLNN